MLTEATEALILPPPFTEVRAAAPFDAALARAAEVGAGGLFVEERPGGRPGEGGRPGVLAFAVVLEPEAPLVEARRAFPLAMAAAADALAALCPPERAVRIGWPDELVYDAARIGGGRLGWPEAAAEDAVPDWLVVGIELIRDREGLAEPGRFPESTSLAEEGFEAPGAIVESFARHLMLHFDTWQAEGFERAATALMLRLPGGGPGVVRRIAGNGDLVVRDRAGREERQALLGNLGRWRDPATGGVRL